MQIPVIIETLGTNHYRVQVAPLSAEGKTSEEALANLRAELEMEIRNGKQRMMLEVSGADDNPWLKMAGSLKDCPIVDEWRAAIEEYRRQCDIEAGIEYVERPVVR